MGLSLSLRLLVFLALALGSLAGSMLGFVSAGILIWEAGRIDPVSLTLLVASSLVFLVGALIGWVFSRFITRPLVTVTAHANRVASGDTSGDLPSWLVGRRDEAGTLAQAFQVLTQGLRAKEGAVRTLASGLLVLDFTPTSPQDALGQDLVSLARGLKTTMEQVVETATEVENHAERVASESQRVTRGSESQAQNVSAATTALGAVQAGARANSDKATDMRVLARSIQGQVEASGRQIDALSAAMQDLTRQAEGIRHTAKTIDDLAFQTNLLALNANIEAARAGAAGKGFAVVAGEVRSLAGKSAGAVVQTRRLVDSILASVGRNTTMAAEVAHHVAGLRSDLDRMSTLAGEVSDEGKRQLESLEAIGGGLDQVDQVTRDNLVLATQEADRARLLEDRARSLLQQLQRFRLGPPGSPGLDKDARGR